MNKKLISLIFISHFLCHPGSKFDPKKLIIALLHDDTKTIEKQLQFLPESKRCSTTFVPVGIKHKLLNPNEQMTPLMVAAYKGNIPILEELHKHWGQINQANEYRRTALMFAALNNQYQCVRWLLQNGAEPHDKDINYREPNEFITFKTKPFIKAALENNRSLVNLFMPQQREVKDKRCNRLVVIKKLNKLYKNRPDENFTPLMALAALQLETNEDRTFFANIAGRLIAMGVKINQQNKYKRTALTYAARSGNGPMLQVLLESSPLLNIVDTFGKKYGDYANKTLLRETSLKNTPEGSSYLDIPFDSEED